MNKVLLVTMQDLNNIGNRLQNYALTTILRSYGAEVTNLDNGYTKEATIKELCKNQIKRVLGKFGNKHFESSYIKFINQKLRRTSNAEFTKNIYLI